RRPDFAVHDWSGDNADRLRQDCCWSFGSGNQHDFDKAPLRQVALLVSWPGRLGGWSIAFSTRAELGRSAYPRRQILDANHCFTFKSLLKFGGQIDAAAPACL